MRKYTVLFGVAVGVLAVLARDVRAQSISIDMDASTPAIEDIIYPAIGSTITVGVMLDLRGGFLAGVAQYDVSVNFDNVELTLALPDPTQSAPTGLSIIAGIPALTPSVSPGLDQVGSFAGAVFGPFPLPGPTSGLYSLGTITLKVNSVLNDGLLDVTPGLFTGFNSMGDNSGNDVSSSFTFVGGKISVVPEPSEFAMMLVFGFVCGATALCRKRKVSS